MHSRLKLDRNEVPEVSHGSTSAQAKLTHKSWKNKKSLQLKCIAPQCDKIFPTKKRLNYHLRMWHEMVECDSCGKSIRKEAFLVHFRMRHSNAFQQDIPCSHADCHRVFATEKLMKRHFWARHTSKECEICHKMIAAKQYRPHINLVHFKREQCICEKCGTILKSISAYEQHMETQHSSNQRVQCEICKKWLKHGVSLRHHRLNMHSRDHASDLINCSICGVTKRSEKALAAHIKTHRTKTENKKFVCGVCGRLCCNRTHLNTHQATHDSSRLAQMMHCKYCDKKYLSKSGFDVSKHKHMNHESLYVTDLSFQFTETYDHSHANRAF